MSGWRVGSCEAVVVVEEGRVEEVEGESRERTAMTEDWTVKCRFEGWGAEVGDGWEERWRAGRGGKVSGEER